jgi:DNA-binding GntR family transcriptional regulator
MDIYDARAGDARRARAVRTSRRQPHPDPRSHRDAGQDGFVKTVPRVAASSSVRRTKSEIVDMIRAWAALEKHGRAADHDDRAQEGHFRAARSSRFRQGSPAADHVEEYSKANIAFHQALISLSESPTLVDMTNDILLHVRGYRQLTIGRTDRTATSLPEHMASSKRSRSDTELAEKRARDHTLGLAALLKRTARSCLAKDGFYFGPAG